MDRPKHPDMQRIQEAMDQMVQWEKTGASAERGGWDELARQHIKVEDLMEYLMEVSVASIKQRPYDRKDSQTHMLRSVQSWMDGFMLGVEYRREEALAEALVGAPGKVGTGALIRKAHNNLMDWAEDDIATQKWAERVDTNSLGYATSSRAITGLKSIREMERKGPAVDDEQVQNATEGATLSADGWTIGYLFQKAGGHRG